jgi:hypothetical protein
LSEINGLGNVVAFGRRHNLKLDYFQMLLARHSPWVGSGVYFDHKIVRDEELL